MRQKFQVAFKKLSCATKTVPAESTLTERGILWYVYNGMDHKLFKVLSHPILRPFPNLFQIKLAFLEKYLHFLQMCGFMMR